ncbi:hypothetical protein RIF29_14476 [Crotalaria pallida]|uniref:Uncharacterized protein n=1 Tax=Crotalaria pallida TaxID=3830 RepID=A0AAN9IBN7_CROPI
MHYSILPLKPRECRLHKRRRFSVPPTSILCHGLFQRQQQGHLSDACPRGRTVDDHTGPRAAQALVGCCGCDSV